MSQTLHGTQTIPKTGNPVRSTQTLIGYANRLSSYSYGTNRASILPVLAVYASLSCGRAYIVSGKSMGVGQAFYRPIVTCISGFREIKSGSFRCR